MPPKTKKDENNNTGDVNQNNELNNLNQNAPEQTNKKKNSNLNNEGDLLQETNENEKEIKKEEQPPQPQPQNPNSKANENNDDQLIDLQNTNINNNNNANQAENTQANKKTELKHNSSDASVFTGKLAGFNSMYKTKIEPDRFIGYISDAWTKIKSGDEEQKKQGMQLIKGVFKTTLQLAFDKERNIAYSENRFPEYIEIIKSTNELMRASMFSFTDLYHDPKSASLFESTSYGGLSEEELIGLTKGTNSQWNMDQKSDAAWEYQSKEAKDIAAEWLKEDRPYEKMINELNALAAGVRETKSYDRREAWLKLAAAEWLLVNNEKMMVENDDDPLNPIPNWDNRYWRTITQTREALGISKYTSMRDLIQGEYAEAAKAINSTNYRSKQIKDNIINPEARKASDSLEVQKEQFAIQSAHADLTEKQKDNENQIGNAKDPQEMSETRKQITINEENQFEKMKNEPKFFGNMVIETSQSLKVDASYQRN